MMTARDYVTAQLLPLLPKRWRLVHTDRNLDTLDRVTVILKLQEVTRTPATPQAGLTTTWTATIITPKQMLEPAELELDDAILDLILALDRIDQLRWTTATRVLYGDIYQAFDITFESLTTRSK